MKNIQNLVFRYFVRVLICLGHRREICLAFQNDGLIRYPFDFIHHPFSRNRDRDDDSCCSFFSAEQDGRLHCRTKGQTVVDQDDSPPRHFRELPPFSQDLHSLPDRLGLQTQEPVDSFSGKASDHVDVDVGTPVLGNRSEARVRVIRAGKLSGDQERKICLQQFRNLEAHLDTATGNRQDEGVLKAVFLKGPAKLSTRCPSVFEHMALFGHPFACKIHTKLCHGQSVSGSLEGQSSTTQFHVNKGEIPARQEIFLFCRINCAFTSRIWMQSQALSPYKIKLRLSRLWHVFCIMVE